MANRGPVQGEAPGPSPSLQALAAAQSRGLRPGPIPADPAPEWVERQRKMEERYFRREILPSNKGPECPGCGYPTDEHQRSLGVQMCAWCQHFFEL